MKLLVSCYHYVQCDATHIRLVSSPDALAHKDLNLLCLILICITRPSQFKLEQSLGAPSAWTTTTTWTTASKNPNRPLLGWIPTMGSWPATITMSRAAKEQCNKQHHGTHPSFYCSLKQAPGCSWSPLQKGRSNLANYCMHAYMLQQEHFNINNY